MSRQVLFVFTLAAVIMWSSAFAATDAEKCESAKEKAAGTYAQCRLKAESRFSKTGDAVRLGISLTKCADRLGKNFDKAEAKYGVACATSGDTDVVDGFLTDVADSLSSYLMVGGPAPLCSNFLATGQTTCRDATHAPIPCAGTGQDGETQSGAPLSYIDNGDGTITDANTGLTWEKKSDDAGIHDMHLLYSWNNALAVHIAGLNTAGFGGHTDWRIPNTRELRSIVNHENADPAVSSEFNTGCTPGCTVLDCSCTAAPGGLFYWSSTVRGAQFNWVINFGDGGDNGASRTTGNMYVRAVRGP